MEDAKAMTILQCLTNMEFCNKSTAEIQTVVCGIQTCVAKILIYLGMTDQYLKGGYLDFSHLTELKKHIYHWNLHEKNNINHQ